MMMTTSTRFAMDRPARGRDGAGSARRRAGAGPAGWVLRVMIALAAGPASWAEPAEEVRRAQVVTVRPAELTRDGAGGGGVAALAVAGEDVEAAAAGSPAVVAADPAPADLRTARRISISLEAGVLYDDNIFLNARDPAEDLLYRASGEARFNLGDVTAREESHLMALYRPDAYFFQENPDENTVDHEASLSVRQKFAKLAVDAAVKYQRTSGSTVELGDRVPRDVRQVRAGLTYGWGAKTSFNTGVQWDGTSYREGAYADSKEWASESFVDYQATGKFRFGLGGGFGQLDVSDGSTPQDFQRALLRVNHAATGKLTIVGRAGVEFRQTEAGRSATPVFGVEATHALTAKTTLRLRGVQEVSASGVLEGQNYLRTGLGLGLAHRLNDRISLSLEGGWDRYDYESVRRATEQIGSERSDNTLFVRPGFTYAFGDRWNAEAWYQWRSTESSDPEQTYDVNQAGLNLRYTF